MLCPICDSKISIRLHQKPGLSVVVCSSCSFVGADLDEWEYPYYSHDYYPVIDPQNVIPDRPFIKHRVQQILHRKKFGKAVDLGCGLGETAVALARAGYDAFGVEESENAVRFLKSTYPDVHWYQMSITDFIQDEGCFDVISLFHVLEHIPSPKMLCRSLSQALNPNGLLVVEVPDAGGGQARLRGWNWQHWLPHHVNYFTRSTLRRLFEPLGLVLEHTEKKYHLGFPQGVWWHDVVHFALNLFGLNDAITTYWRKTDSNG